MCEADIGKQNGHNTLYNAKQSKVDRVFTGGKFFFCFLIVPFLLLTFGRTRKFIPPPWYKGVGWMDPPPRFLMCCSISKRFYLQWKAFDILHKMRYILWVVALLGACDVTKNGRHLGFYQEFEIRLKPREMVIFLCLRGKTTQNKHFA